MAGFGLANGAHYCGMDDLERKIIDHLVAISLAPIAALAVGYVAHYLFGAPPNPARVFLFAKRLLGNKA